MDGREDQETPGTGIAHPGTDNVLKCPVCGCEIPSSQQKLLVALSMINDPETQIVVCHCPESHRFVASLKKTAKKARSA